MTDPRPAGINRLGFAARWSWAVYMAGAGIVGYLYVKIPAWGDKGLIFNIIGASSVAAILGGIHIHRPTRRLPWLLMALGMALFVVGDAFYYTIPKLTNHAAPSLPSIGDGFYLAVYPLLVAGVLLLIHHRNQRRDWPSVIDALIITTGVAMVVWVFLIVPYARDPQLSLLRKVVTIAYPLMDIALLAVTARLAVDGGRRKPAFALMFTSMLSLLGTDIIYGLIELHSDYVTGGLLDAGWIAFYVLLGAAALHPSMESLSEPAPERDTRLSPSKLVLLAVATLMAPAVQLAQGVLGYAPLVVVAGSAVLFLLVVARMGGLIRRHEASLKRERALRETAAALATAPSRTEILSAAARGLGGITGKARQVRVNVVGDYGSIVALSPSPSEDPGPGPDPVVNSSGSASHWTDLAWSHPALLKRLSQQLGHSVGEPVVWACPLSSAGRVSAFVTVSGRQRLSPDVESIAHAITAQVVLALETHDLSEQVHRERSEARFLSLVQNATDVVTVVDPDTKILYQSPSVERVLGYAPRELLGTLMADLLHPEDRERALALLAKIDGEKSPTRVEFRVRHADGSWRDIETFQANLLNDPNVGGYVLNCRDVTEQRRAREEQELLERRLEQSQRLEAIGQLAGGVAHDFNNMLAIILTYGNFVTKALDRQAQRCPEDAAIFARICQDAERINEAALSAAALVHQLLILGRRDSVHPEVLDVNSIVGQLVRLLERTLGEHIVLRTRLAPGTRPVRVDRSGLDQVLMNLVINARDAMATGGTLTIETSNFEVDRVLPWAPDLAPGCFVCLSVTDTGTGMSREVAARAFEPFFTTKPQGEGVGLGLATAYGIVKQAGGDTHLYSIEGVGTTVKIFLPAAPLPSTAQVAETPTPPVPRRKGNGERILLVEDEENVREGTCRLLVESGYEVVTASDGMAAMRAFTSHADWIDLLLTDMVMPGMSGRELAARLTASRPGLRVLYMSGYPRDAWEAGGSSGDAGVLSKPFTSEGLLEAVDEALGSVQATWAVTGSHLCQEVVDA